MAESEYKMPDTGEFYVTREIQASFDQNGYILVRGLFNTEEVARFTNYMEQSKPIKENAYGKSDGMERFSRMCLWNVAGDDISGVVAR
jgi:hypothetical protein